jgi:putative serine protease PepD
MAEHDASRGSLGEGSDDSQYYGPFGPDRTASQPPGPAYSAPASGENPAPSVPPPPSLPPPTPPRKPGPRSGATIGIAALTAAVIGGSAGYGGARLAESQPPALASASASASVSSEPSATASRAPVPAAPPAANTVAVAKRVLPSTVMIKVGRATGSGFVLDRRGRIMTNNHVVARAAGGTKITVIFSGGRRAKAKLVGRSPSYDIAVIKVKATSTLRPVEVGDSDRSEVGQPVIAVGSPLGLPGTVTQGIVSAHHRPVVVSENADADTPTAYIDAIQTDASINPGNSGGPLVDTGARIIGVNSAILTLGSGQAPSGNIGLGFAIPINQAVTIGDQLIKRGKATYPVLGANLDNASGGVELTSVSRTGPARKAGLRSGDLINRVDGRKVATPEELIVSIRTRRPGDRVDLKYTRGSAERTARVRLGSKEG